MSSYTIEVDEEVYAELKRDAEPFEDTPNSVLRRRLGLPAKGETTEGRRVPNREGRHRKDQRKTRRRAPSGALLPESEYELPILRVLVECGGRAATQEVVTAVGTLVEDRLTELDKEAVGAGGRLRWQSRVQFARLRMVERGWIANGSPRGVWEITAAGRDQLRSGDAS